MASPIMAPGAYDAQEEAIRRRMKFAEALQTPTASSGQMVGNHFVPMNPIAGLADILRAKWGADDRKGAEQELQDLGTKRQEAMSKALRTFGEMSNPSQEGLGPTNLVNDALPEEFQIGAQTQLPARKPDMQGAYASLIESGIPQLQQFGIQGTMSNAQEQLKAAQQQRMQQQLIAKLQAAKTPQEAMLSGVPTDMVKNYYESGNWGKDKGVAINGQLVNPMTGEPIGQAIPKQVDLGAAKLIPDGKGGWMPNPAMVAYERETAPLKAPKVTVSVNEGQKGFENETTLGKGFKSEPIYKDYNEMRSSYGQVKAALAQGTPIGDVAGATKMMKLLDPGSVVRESELGIAMAAAGKVDRLKNYFDMWKSGKKLTPEQRTEFSALSDELYNVAGNVYNETRAQYDEQGKRYGLNTSILGKEHSMPKTVVPANDKRPSLDSFKR